MFEAVCTHVVALMETLYQVHPISIAGSALFLAGLAIVVLLFFSHELSYGSLKLKGTLHRTKKWPAMQRLAVVFLILGSLFFAIGFAFPKVTKASDVVPESTWYGMWNIQFQSGNDSEALLPSAETIRFYQYSNKGEHILEGEIKDGDGKQIGSFQRLCADAGSHNFRVIKGQFKINGGKTIKVELALLGNKDVFSGIVYESTAARRQTCWGKRR